MKYSLIMATLGRYDEISEFCESLLLQNEKDLELIIVDQNDNDKVEKIAKAYSDKLNIVYIHSDIKGLSYNRNLGLRVAKGDIIAFPDDDCRYLPETLAFIEEQLSKFDFCCLNTKDFDTEKSNPHSAENEWNITYKNFYNGGSSSSFFVIKKALEGFLFDEQLGVGAKYGSGEESDMLLYMLSKRCNGYYFGNTYIHHPAMDYSAIKTNYKRIYNYALGFGAMYKKAVSVYGRKELFWPYIFALCKSVVGIFIRSPKMYWLTLKGRILGYVRYRPE